MNRALAHALQLPLPNLHASLQAELRDRRYTISIVALNALVTLRPRAWNTAWALAEKAVPPTALPLESHS